jgi:hypothetical protein
MGTAVSSAILLAGTKMLTFSPSRARMPPAPSGMDVLGEIENMGGDVSGGNWIGMVKKDSFGRSVFATQTIG